MKPIIIIENIRSAYNVGNIIRTADGLWYDVILSWFSPSPFENESVKKTSLGAEEEVHLRQFRHVQEAIDEIKGAGFVLISAEIVPWKSVALDVMADRDNVLNRPIALVLGNENTWVMESTLEQSDYILHIPMQGLKESLNVGQAAAIFMWELRKSLAL